GFPRVPPDAIDHVVLHDPAPNVLVVDVGDLQLSPARGSKPGDDLEDRGVVEVDAGHGELAGRVCRLLDDAADAPAAVEVGHAEMAKVRLVLDPGQQDACAARLSFER